MDTMPMENRVTTPFDQANMEVMTVKPMQNCHTYDKLNECYRHLASMSENRRIPYAVMSTLHNHATKILRELRP